MANKQRGEIALKLGEKSLTLVPSYQHFVEIEEATDFCLIELTQRMSAGQCTLKMLVDVVEILSETQNLGEAIYNAVGGYTKVMAKVGQCLVIGIGGSPSGKAKAVEK